MLKRLSGQFGELGVAGDQTQRSLGLERYWCPPGGLPQLGVFVVSVAHALVSDHGVPLPWLRGLEGLDPILPSPSPSLPRWPRGST